jgi:DNA-binding NtrC family response regulator
VIKVKETVDAIVEASKYPMVISAPAAPGVTLPDVGSTLEIARARFERWFIERALEEEAGDVPRVLTRIEVPKGTFYRKCAALSIEPARFRSRADR